MHKPKSFLKNEMYKIHWQFEIQTDYFVLDRRPGIVLVNKKRRTCHLLNFAIPEDRWVKIKEIILGSCQRAEKSMEHARDWQWNQ